MFSLGKKKYIIKYNEMTLKLMLPSINTCNTSLKKLQLCYF